MVINQRDHAIVSFDQRRAAFHPVTAVVISDSAEFADRCAVDVTAQHGVDVVTLRIMSHSGFEFTDKTDGVLHRSLGIGTEGPVAQAEMPPDEVNKRIEREEKLVANVACEREPLHPAAAGHHHVEFVTVNNQYPLACGGHMDCVLLNLDIPVGATEARHQFVVISRDVNYAGALAGFAENFLDHIVVLLWPVNCAPQRPDIDEIAHDVQRVEIGFAQKVQQRSGVATARAQVRVGNPRRPIAFRS